MCYLNQESYNYNVEIVKCSKAPKKRVMDKSAWKSFLKKSDAVVLDSMQGEGIQPSWPTWNGPNWIWALAW